MFETTVLSLARSLLERVAGWGIHVRREGDQFRIEGESSRLDAENLARLRETRLRCSICSPTWTMREGD